MSNGHLIPTPRVNKNGVVVTKHVKPQPVSSVSGTIPAPASPVLPLSPDMVTLPPNVKGLADLWNSHRISHSKITLDDFDPRAVEMINGLIQEADALGRKIGLNHAIAQSFDLMRDHEVTNGFHNVAVFGGCVLKHVNTDVTPFIVGLQELTAPRDIDYLLEATDEERLKALALVEFTARAEDSLGKPVIYYSDEDPEEIMEYTHLRDPELTKFIMDHPESSDDVFEILRAEGGPLPVDVILERLKHTEKALREGVL